MKILACFLLAAGLGSAASHCSLHQKQDRTVSYVRKPALPGIAKLDPLAWTRPDNLIGYLAAAAGVPASEFCAYHKAFDRWVAWRKANPKAKSRWHPESDKKSLAAIQDDMIQYMSDEPPDFSGFGQCGCPLDVALTSCGWVHSQVWQSQISTGK